MSWEDKIESRVRDMSPKRTSYKQGWVTSPGVGDRQPHHHHHHHHQHHHHHHHHHHHQQPIYYPTPIAGAPPTGYYYQPIPHTPGYPTGYPTGVPVPPEQENDNEEIINQLKSEKKTLEDDLTDVTKELDGEREQNVQSAAVISQQMTLIEDLKSKMDGLMQHNRTASEQQQATTTEANDLRRLIAALQEELQADNRHKASLEIQLGSLQDELTRERSETMKEKRLLETVRMDHARELEELLRHHQLEQATQHENNTAREAELTVIRQEKEALSQRVHEIQIQREEEARSLQQEIVQHLSVVETLKSELRNKQAELFEDWKNCRQELADEKSVLTTKIEGERIQLEEDRRRLDNQRARSKMEADTERESMMNQLQAREARLALREQEVEKMALEKTQMESEIQKLRTENAVLSELRVDRDRWQQECHEQEEKFRAQLHDLRNRHHAKLEEQCRKHSEAIDMVNRLRSQLSATPPPPPPQVIAVPTPENPQDIAYLEKKLLDTERKLMESEHSGGQLEGRVQNMQAELTAADSRVRRSEDHIQELSRQIVEYKQELTDARTEREHLRVEVQRMEQAMHSKQHQVGDKPSEVELRECRQEIESLRQQLHVATLANREEKFVHLCGIHKSEGFEGLMKQDLAEDEPNYTKESSKAAYIRILTALERVKLQPFVCAGCVTEMHHAFDELLRTLFVYNDTAPEIGETEDTLSFLMALTSRLGPSGEKKVHDTADALLRCVLAIEGAP